VPLRLGIFPAILIPPLICLLQGLNELVPDSLLCIFDERELELLLCGTGKIDLDDFKAHTKVMVILEKIGCAGEFDLKFSKLSQPHTTELFEKNIVTGKTVDLDGF
jgi:hypothetical protein